MNGDVVGIRPETSRPASLVFGGCLAPDRVKHFALSTQACLLPTSQQVQARSRPRCPISYQRTADILA